MLAFDLACKNIDFPSVVGIISSFVCAMHNHNVSLHYYPFYYFEFLFIICLFFLFTMQQKNLTNLGKKDLERNLFSELQNHKENSGLCSG